MMLGSKDLELMLGNVYVTKVFSQEKRKIKTTGKKLKYNSRYGKKKDKRTSLNPGKEGDLGKPKQAYHSTLPCKLINCYQSFDTIFLLKCLR